MEILIVKLIFMSYIIFNHLVGTEAMTIDELTDELQFVETDLSLFTGESVVKEKLIVREILELKRSVFLLKAMVNNTSKASRDLRQADDQLSKSRIMEILTTLENRIDSLANNKQDEHVLGLEKQVQDLKTRLEIEIDNRIKLQKEVTKIKKMLKDKEL